MEAISHQSPSSHDKGSIGDSINNNVINLINVNIYYQLYQISIKKMFNLQQILLPSKQN